MQRDTLVPRLGSNEVQRNVVVNEGDSPLGKDFDPTRNRRAAVAGLPEIREVHLFQIPVQDRHPALLASMVVDR